MELKRCPRCEEVKPVDAFALTQGKRVRRAGYCKSCVTGAARARLREKRGLPLDAPLMRGMRWDAAQDGATRPSKFGYVQERRVGHHRQDKAGWVFQHILVAEDKYGFPITRDFTVHHINADRADNRPENLELRKGPHGRGGDVLPTILKYEENQEAAAALLRSYGWTVEYPNQKG